MTYDYLYTIVKSILENVASNPHISNAVVLRPPQLELVVINARNCYVPSMHCISQHSALCTRCMSIKRSIHLTYIWIFSARSY